MVGLAQAMPVHTSAAIVVGSGVAGMTVALGLDDCLLLTDTTLGAGGSSRWAQGGVAAAIGPGDSPAAHAADTVRVSSGLADADVARTITEGGPRAIAQLIELGAKFDRGPGGDFAYGQEAGHSARRILHANGDTTGAELVRTLVGAVRLASSVNVIEDTVVVDLVRRGDRVVGVIAARAGRLTAYLAEAVVLATGGYAHCYRQTTTPREAIGTGITMAARAGADLADMEFVQFHPTALAVDGLDQMPLLTEALRGEGAILVDESGERYLVDEHPDAELAPRDVVARANYRQLAEGHTPYLDAREAIGEGFEERFPTVFSLAQRHGLDPRVDRLPVSPAAHYCMGGIAVDAAGRTSLPGLWVVGEATSSGLHGANRLASNSLLEGLVMGESVAVDVAAHRGSAPVSALVEVSVPSNLTALAQVESPEHQEIELDLRRLLWSGAGVERNRDGLQRGLDGVQALAGAASSSWRCRSVQTVAVQIFTAALARCESRGAHYRTDMPMPDPATTERRIVSPDPVAYEPWQVQPNGLVATPMVAA